MAARRVFSLSFAVTKITGVLPPRRDNDVDEGNCAPVYLGWTVSCAMVAQAIALVRLGRKQEAIAVLARIRRRRPDGARDLRAALAVVWFNWRSPPKFGRHSGRLILLRTTSR
jgi:hypothetical protein